MKHLKWLLMYNDVIHLAQVVTSLSEPASTSTSALDSANCHHKPEIAEILSDQQIKLWEACMCGVNRSAWSSWCTVVCTCKPSLRAADSDCETRDYKTMTLYNVCSLGH